MSVEWLTLQQISDETRIPVQTLRNMRSRRQGPKGYLIGNSLRFKRSDVDAWLEGHADPDKTREAA